MRNIGERGEITGVQKRGKRKEIRTEIVATNVIASQRLNSDNCNTDTNSNCGLEIFWALKFN